MSSAPEPARANADNTFEDFDESPITQNGNVIND